MTNHAMLRAALLLGVTLAVGCVSATPTSAQSGAQSSRRAAQTDVDARVRTLLSGIETAPTRDEVLALGDAGLEALLRLHADPSAVGALRLRAITCISWFPGARPHDFLVGLLHDAQTEPLQLRAGIRALAARESAASVQEIVRHAQHADVAVREAVLLSLVTLRTAEGVSTAERTEIGRTLEALLALERDAELVRSIRSRLQAPTK